MTIIEFRTHIADKIRYTCHWVKDTLAKTPDSKMVLFSHDKTVLNKLDEALWTFQELLFLPHAMLGDPQASRSPIILTSDDHGEMPHHDILVNLSSKIPACYDQFDRLIELVSKEAADTSAGRLRYVHYREHGHTPLHETARQ